MFMTYLEGKILASQNNHRYVFVIHQHISSLSPTQAFMLHDIKAILQFAIQVFHQVNNNEPICQFYTS